MLALARPRRSLYRRAVAVDTRRAPRHDVGRRGRHPSRASSQQRPPPRRVVRPLRAPSTRDAPCVGRETRTSTRLGASCRRTRPGSRSSGDGCGIRSAFGPGECIDTHATGCAPIRTLWSPERLSLFGLTRLPAPPGCHPALAEHREVPLPPTPFARALGTGRRGHDGQASDRPSSG